MSESLGLMIQESQPCWTDWHSCITRGANSIKPSRAINAHLRLTKGRMEREAQRSLERSINWLNFIAFVEKTAMPRQPLVAPSLCRPNLPCKAFVSLSLKEL